jgi:hypothetical protein
MALIVKADNLAIQNGVLRLEEQLNAGTEIGKAGKAIPLPRHQPNTRWVCVSQALNPSYLTSNSQSGWENGSGLRVSGNGCKTGSGTNPV